MAKDAITFADIASYPAPGMKQPISLQFSPDGSALACLLASDGTLTRELSYVDLLTGETNLLVKPDGGVQEETLSIEEKLRRERQRQLHTGITTYFWAQSANAILVPVRGGIYLQPSVTSPLQAVVPTSFEGGLVDPKLSPNDGYVSFVRDSEAYAVPIENWKPVGEPVQITKGARGYGKTNGLADYIAQEEMDRYTGYWWSLDSAHIAFVQVDESHIPVFRINHQGSDTNLHEDHRYPFAGTENCRVRLGVVPVDGSGEAVWMDLGPSSDIYLARVDWLPCGALTAQVQSRDQTRLDLLKFDIKTGAAEVLLTETTDVWINLHDMFVPLPDADAEAPGGFLWASERSGFRHLYLHGADGKEIRALTSGEWVVDSIAAVDTERQRVYFHANKEGPTSRDLYWATYTGECAADAPTRMTEGDGWHEAVVHSSSSVLAVADVFSKVDMPPVTTLRVLEHPDAAAVRALELNRCSHAHRLVVPQITTLKSRDGADLCALAYVPDPAVHGPGPYPTVVNVYGGPCVQYVTNRWHTTVQMRCQHLCSKGYLVLRLDNRGSLNRGLAFEGAIKHNMGDLELKDQVDGVEHFAKLGLADAARVGIYGWSYGGYMSAMALCRAPETFKVAVAGAPVTHWDGYDTHYTERYMGTPASNAKGYMESAVMHHVPRMEGKLLLVHGLIDENVHFRHTARLINALIKHRKDYELLLFPNERHSPRSFEDRLYMEERIFRFFANYL